MQFIVDGFDGVHLLGQSALHPPAPRSGRQAALLLLAGITGITGITGSMGSKPAASSPLQGAGLAETGLLRAAAPTAHRCCWSRSARSCLAPRSRHRRAHPAAVSRLMLVDKALAAMKSEVNAGDARAATPRSGAKWAGRPRRLPACRRALRRPRLRGCRCRSGRRGPVPMQQTGARWFRQCSR